MTMKNTLLRFPIQNQNGKKYTNPNESRVITRFTNHHGEKPSERMKGGKATTSRLFATTHVTTKGTDTIPEVDDTTKQRDA